MTAIVSAYAKCPGCGKFKPVPLASIGQGDFARDIDSLLDLFIGVPKAEAPANVFIEGNASGLSFRIIHAPTFKVWSHGHRRWIANHDGGFWYVGRDAARTAWDSMVASGIDPAASEAAASGDAPAASTTGQADCRQAAAESRAEGILRDKAARVRAQYERFKADFDDLLRHFAT